MGIPLVVAAFQVLAAVPPANPDIVYDLRYPRAGAEYVEVRITLTEPAAGPVTLIIPRAVPMGYASVPYDRFVEEVEGQGADGSRVVATRGEGPRWTVGGVDDAIREVSYRVNVARMERDILSASDASKLRDGYAGFLGYTVFGFLEGREQERLRLEIEGPRGWPVFTTLVPEAWGGRWADVQAGRGDGAASDPAPGRVTATADRFYDLADAQIMMGPDLQVRRVDGPIPVYLAVYAETDVDLDIVARLAAEAMRRVVAYFDSAPMTHYTVHQEYLEPISRQHEYGFSMEHMESGTFFLGVDRAVTPATSRTELDRTLFNFMHHFAHSWVPKRAYGPGYFPFQWELAPLIETIWLSEGWVRYATIEMTADALPEAEGEAYRTRVLDGFREDLERMPAFLNAMSLPELSRTGSTAYSEDFRVGRSLFMRGALMAADLDARIRERSEGYARFRDVLRYLVRWSARERRAFQVSELPSLILSATGVEVGGIMRRRMRKWEGDG